MAFFMQQLPEKLMSMLQHQDTKILFTLPGNTIYTNQKRKRPENVHNSCYDRRMKQIWLKDIWMLSASIINELSATGVVVSGVFESVRTAKWKRMKICIKDRIPRKKALLNKKQRQKLIPRTTDGISCTEISGNKWYCIYSNETKISIVFSNDGRKYVTRRIVLGKRYNQIAFKLQQGILQAFSYDLVIYVSKCFWPSSDHWWRTELKRAHWQHLTTKTSTFYQGSFSG